MSIKPAARALAETGGIGGMALGTLFDTWDTGGALVILRAVGELAGIEDVGDLNGVDKARS